MSNYNDTEGFKIIAPFSAVKKPWGNGLATGAQYAKVENYSSYLFFDQEVYQIQKDSSRTRIFIRRSSGS